jgi:nucleoside-diphosphate-sugar epimerase
VVHCAAETAGGKEAHSRNSINATRNILTAMANAGVKKFLHISSIAVLKTSHETGMPVDENTPVVSENDDRGPYVWGKALSERLSLEIGSKLGIEVRIIRPGPLMNYEAFEAPGRLGREVGPWFIYFGSGKSKLSICDVKTASKVIRKYVEGFHSMPPILNLVEPVAPTRGELVSSLLNIRPDLKAFSFPFILLKALSPGLILLQKILRPKNKPVNIYAAFSSERYGTDLADKIIKQSEIMQ